MPSFVSKGESERQAQVVADMVERERARALERGDAPAAEATAMQRTDDTAQITFAVKTGANAGGGSSSGSGGVQSVFKQKLKGGSAWGSGKSGSGASGGLKRKLTAMERIKEEEERKKQQKLDQDRMAAEEAAAAAAAAAVPPPGKKKDYWPVHTLFVEVGGRRRRTRRVTVMSHSVV